MLYYRKDEAKGTRPEEKGKKKKKWTLPNEIWSEEKNGSFYHVLILPSRLKKGGN